MLAQQQSQKLQSRIDWNELENKNRSCVGEEMQCVVLVELVLWKCALC